MKEYFILDSSHFHQMTVFITTAISKLVGRGLKVRKKLKNFKKIFINIYYFKLD